MVPPPSAVMQPSRQTPTQSMLRRPAASAALIACAASATSERMCSTLSLGGRPHIVPSRLIPVSGFHCRRSCCARKQRKFRGTRADILPLSRQDQWRNPAMATELNPNDPYDRDHLRDPIRTNIGERRSPAEIDNDLQVDPELADGPARNGRLS